MKTITKLFTFLLMLSFFASFGNSKGGAVFSVSESQGCAPLFVQISNSSSFSDTTGMTFRWNISDDQGWYVDFTGWDISYNFETPGYYNINMTAFDSLGYHVGDYSHGVEVQGFSGVFQTKPYEACPGESADFYVSVENYNSVVWNFGEQGGSSSGGDYHGSWQQYSFENEGEYPVTVIVDHQCGVDTVTQNFMVSSYAMPTAEIYAHGGTEACPGDEISFSAHEGEEYTFEWDFGDGSSIQNNRDVSHSYSAMGSYTVQMKVYNKCGNYNMNTVTVDIGDYYSANAGFGWDDQGNSCPGENISFYAQSPGSYQWIVDGSSVGGSREMNYSFADTGSYNVILVVNNGCGYSDTSMNTIMINYNPDHRPGAWMQFENFENYGKYGNGIDTIVVCPETEVAFASYNENGKNDELQYEWTFGDGDSAIGDGASHIFSSLGVNTVQLIVTNSCGGSDTAYKWVNVDNSIMPETRLLILPESLCPGERVYFYDEEYGDDKSNEEYTYSVWYGDGQSDLNIVGYSDSSIHVQASHIYDDAGTYNYVFTATNSCGNSDSLTGVISVDTSSSREGIYQIYNSTIGNTGMAFEDWSERRSADDHEFIIPITWPEWNNSMSSVVWVAFWEGGIDWSSGGKGEGDDDGGPDGEPTGIVRLDQLGVTTAYIPSTMDTVGMLAIWFCSGEITGDPGAMGFVHNQVVEKGGKTQLPFPGIQITQWEDGDLTNCDPGNAACPGDTVGFMVIGGVSHEWHFGDGSTATGTVAKHAYQTAGKYQAYSLSTNACGRVDTVKTSVFVGNDVYPSAHIETPDHSGCVNSDFYFYGHSEDDYYGNVNIDVDNKTYLWDFGDGTTSSEKDPVHIYTTTGSYNVSFTVTNSCGNSDYSTRGIYIDGPSLNMETEAVYCKGEFVTISADGGYSDYTWSTGSKDQSISVGTDGEYTVSVSDNNGCVATKTINVYENDLSSGYAGADVAVCYGGSSYLTATGGEYYSWDNGENNMTIFVTPDTTTIYLVTVTDANGCESTDDIVVSIDTSLVADAGLDVSICQGESTNLYGSGGYSYTWAPQGYVDNYTVYNPVANPMATTTYTVTVDDGTGCSASDEVIVVVNSVPTVNESPDTSICLGETVSLHVSGNADTYTWDYNEMTGNSIVIQPEYSLTINIIGENSFGCTSSASVFVDVMYLPNVNAGNDTGVCVGNTISLVAEGGYAYLWNTGAVTQAITLTPQTGSMYTVTATEYNGCSASDDVYLYAFQAPPVNVGSDMSICSGESTTLVAEGGRYFYWSENQGAESKFVTVEPLQEATYSVVAYSEMGCSASDEITVSVTQISCSFKPMVDDTTRTVTFDNFSSGTDLLYFWNFGNGTTSHQQSPAVIYPRAGAFEICLTAFDTTNGCQKESCQTVFVGDVPCYSDWDAAQPDSSNTVAFYNYSSQNATSWFWSFGDGKFSNEETPSHQYKLSGVYDVCLTVFDGSNGCQAKICKDVQIGTDICQADFTHFINNSNNTVSFTSTSIGSPSNWHWNFGDGKHSSEKDPKHQYSAAGVYEVCHGIMDSLSACHSQVCEDVLIGTDLCNAAFSYFVDMNTQKLSVTDESIGDPNGWYWTFGDGTFIEAQDTSYTYSSTGAYKVCLHISTASGCTSKKCERVLVGSNSCYADFNFFIDPADNSVSFNNASSANINRLAWDFGDGTTSFGNNPMHRYNEAGYYMVKLVGMDTVSKCVNHSIEFIQVGTVDCFADFEYSVDMDSNIVSFTNKSSDNSAHYYWNFNDGSSSEEENPVHKFSESGMYHVVLTVRNAGGLCMDYVYQEIQVGVIECNASFTAFVDSSTNTVSFQNDVLGSSTNMFWEFGDGSSTTNPNPTYRYSAPGYYYVSLSTFNNANGCMDYYSEVILVGSMGFDCESDFIYQVQDKTVSFSDNSFGTSISKYRWFFGDGDTSTTQDPNHTYLSAGFYNVCFTVVDEAYFCRNTSCKVIKVGEDTTKCHASFIYSVDTTSNTVSFVDKSFGNIDEWEWSFGDGTGSSSSQNPSYTFADTGYYKVKLIVRNSKNNSRNKYVDLLNVGAGNNGLKAVFGYEQDSAGGKGVYPTDFSGASFGEPASFSWSFGDGGTNDLSLTPTHNYADTGTFTVCLSVSDPNVNQYDTYCENLNVVETSIDRAAAKEMYVLVYPNPSNGIININVSGLEGEAGVEVFNMHGQSVYSADIENDTKKWEKQLSMDNYPKGVYFIKVTDANASGISKIIIQ